MALLGFSFVALLCAISVFDLKHYIIPDFLVLLLFGLGVAKMLLEGHFFPPLFGASLLFGFFLLVHLLFPRGMGFGDVKLAGTIGLFLGWKLGVLAVLLSFFLGSIVGVLLILFRKRTLKDPLPFGPFLALGATLSFFCGERILEWYLGMWVL